MIINFKIEIVPITAPALRAGRHEGSEAEADLPDLAGESPVHAVVIGTDTFEDNYPTLE